MWHETLNSLDNLSLDDLYQLKNHLDLLIQKKKDSNRALDKRTSNRAQVKIAGTVEIEREKEFFDQTHKINIHEMSTNGLILTIPTVVIENDILTVTFRVPSNGEKKIIACKALRVKEIPSIKGNIFEVAAQAVDKNTVKAYRSMLKKRGR